ncbi:hypothetical protein CEXT_494881 [Caerostris extrusa]|uniref:Uncharacterized protein n=1 Tax=Caerostris extrusa TaxID=172846 RepID=A0AAV4XDK6_CAEEX|nr:hypothetical protein CEXT_494881 [Caerostris extrusa]
MNRTSTFQSSPFPQNTDQESHWDVNNTAGTDVRYASVTLYRMKALITSPLHKVYLFRQFNTLKILIALTVPKIRQWLSLPQTVQVR